jgi:hypothetical protein
MSPLAPAFHANNAQSARNNVCLNSHLMPQGSYC